MTLVSVTSRRSGKLRLRPNFGSTNVSCPNFLNYRVRKFSFAEIFDTKLVTFVDIGVISFVFIFVTSVRLEILISDYI